MSRRILFSVQWGISLFWLVLARCAAFAFTTIIFVIVFFFNTHFGKGFYSSAGATMCASCAAGNYQASTGAGICIPCTAGTYSNEVGAISSTTCTSCIAGKCFFHFLLITPMCIKLFRYLQPPYNCGAYCR